MEMVQEKTKNIHRVTQFSHYNPIPLDVTREILLRLPAKSLVKFRCVSKLWSSITNQPDFIKSFATRSSARPRLLLSFKQEDKRLFFSLPQHEIPDEKCLSHDNDVSNIHINLPQNDGYMSNFESVHGLISFHHCLNHIVVWNPSIRQHVTLPKPENSRHGASYLGYDLFGDTYKLLCMPHIEDYCPHRREYGPRVLTLGVEESWRLVTEESPPPMYGLSTSWKCINGVLYYEVYIPNGANNNNFGPGHMKRIIMSFNVRFEMFKSIKLPCCMGNTHTTKHSLLSYERRLALVCSSDTKIWILENVEEEKWLCNDLHLPSPQMDSINYILSDVTVNGEFIYVAGSWYDDKEIHILYYDLKTNSIIRKIKFEGIRYKEFKINDGFGQAWNSFGCIPNHIGIVFKEFWKFTRCSPNHIESLVSLKNITCSSLL